MIVRYKRNDELTHYGVKGMKWKNHRASQHPILSGGGDISGNKRSHVHLSDEQKELIKKSNESRRKVKENKRASTIASYKANEVKNSMTKNDRVESMKKDVQERVDRYLTKGEKSDRHKLNSKRKNRENTGKRQINSVKENRSNEKNKRNSMWALQKSYNRSVKQDTKHDKIVENRAFGKAIRKKHK